MNAWRRDLARDELNRSWDAVVDRNAGAQPGDDSDDAVLLRRFHALNAAPSPSSIFLADLEWTLAALPPAHVAKQTGIRASEGASLHSTRPAVPVPGFRSIPKPHRWTSMQAALAVLAVLLIGSLLLLHQAVPRSSEPPAIPAAVIHEPSLEDIAQFNFAPPMWGMPDATTWDYMYFDLFQLEPGKSFSTGVDWFTSVNGPLLLVVVSGELTVHPAGPALLYPANRENQKPVEISAGQAVLLVSGDAIVYASPSSASGSSSGSTPAVVLLGNIGHNPEFGSSGFTPIDIRSVDRIIDSGRHAPPTAGASISIQRLRMSPFETFVFEPDPAWTDYLCVFDQFQMSGIQMASGAFDAISLSVETDRLYKSAQLTYPDPGPHTLFNFGDTTVEFYFLIIEPAPISGTPTP